MRRYELDHLRTIVILLLFPVHTFMIWNSFGEKFYIWDGADQLLSTFIVLVNPWMMPLLFVIAGISAKHSLQKRSSRQFMCERLRRLLVPFIIGIILLVPIQTLMARKFYFNYTGGLLENEFYFFTHVSDFSGSDGGFSPGHLWFLEYLFVISLAALPIIRFVDHTLWPQRIKSLSFSSILFLAILIWLAYPLGNIGGYSLGKYMTLYLIGYYVLSQDEIIARCMEKRRFLYALFVLGECLLGTLFYIFSYYGDLLVNVVGWLGILTGMTMAYRHGNRACKTSINFHRQSFSIYYYHQTILVVWGYYVLTHYDHFPFSMILILFGSFLLTMLCTASFDYLKSFLRLRKSRRCDRVNQ